MILTVKPWNWRMIKIWLNGHCYWVFIYSVDEWSDIITDRTALQCLSSNIMKRDVPQNQRVATGLLGSLLYKLIFIYTFVCKPPVTIKSNRKEKSLNGWTLNTASERGHKHMANLLTKRIKNSCQFPFCNILGTRKCLCVPYKLLLNYVGHISLVSKYLINVSPVH